MKQLIEKFKASKVILFDLDGVITNTMPIHCKSWQKAFQSLFHIQVSRLEIYKREGEKSEKSIKEILKAHSICVDSKQIKQVAEFKADIFNKHNKILFFKGMKTFIKELSEKSKITGIVTGTQRKELNRILNSEFRNYFEVLITSNDVTHGKPHPEPYLNAMKALNASPCETLVIENAPLGIQSALASKTEVCALPTSLPVGELKEATYICPSHEDLYRILKYL